MHRRGALVWTSIGLLTIAACGGVTTEGARGDKTSEGGAGGHGSNVVATDAGMGGAPTPVFAGDPGSGGATAGQGSYQPGRGDGGATVGAGGSYISFPVGTGGVGIAAGGSTGGAPNPPPTVVDAGNGCRNVFEYKSWGPQCAPFMGCLNLDPESWSPVADDPPSDDPGAMESGSVAELAFCGPHANRQYLFAFDESGASYDDFNIVTGDTACSGKSLAFIGVGGVGDAPLTKLRTHCFSVDGKLLGSRLAIVPLDSNAVLSNLRAVSACPCPYPIPYNVNSCPGVEGSAGHPNCG